MVIRDHTYNLTFVGLKPSTRHYFYIDKEPVSSTLLMPYGRLCGDPLISDITGRITFTGFYVTEAFNVSNVEQLRLVDKSRRYRTRVGVLCNINVPVLTDVLYDQATSRGIVYF